MKHRVVATVWLVTTQTQNGLNMPPKGYYEVPTDCYLFKYDKQPEEQVRQWVLFELLSTYGYLINHIKTEVTIKYGTVNCRADIVIYQNQKPFIVIECKRRDGYRKSQEPMAQAKSYAAAPVINAPFAVYTDGNSWQVEKLTAHGWVVYPDIPNNKGYTATIHLADWLNDLHEVKSVLYWLHQNIPTKYSLQFLQASQPMFVGSSLITSGTDEHLLIALDNLLRSVATKDDFNGYHYEKLNTSFVHVQQYLSSIGAKNYANDPFEYNRHELLTIPYFQLSQLVADTAAIRNDQTVAAIELLAVLYRQLKDIAQRPSKYKFELAYAVTTSLFEYIDIGLVRNLNINLPDKTDVQELNEVRERCKCAWKEFIAERSKVKELINVVLAR